MQKVLAAMARRGYSYEDSRTAIEAAIRLEDEEE
jgi:SOS response regulatory protein OraA/RecX